MIDSLPQINGGLSSGQSPCHRETCQVSRREIYSTRKRILFARGTAFRSFNDCATTIFADKTQLSVRLSAQSTSVSRNMNLFLLCRKTCQIKLKKERMVKRRLKLSSDSIKTKILCSRQGFHLSNHEVRTKEIT